MIAGLSFISWTEFPDSCNHLLVRDGLHACHEGTYIVVKKFRRVCRELVPSVSVPMNTTTASVPTKPTSNSVLYLWLVVPLYVRRRLVTPYVRSRPVSLYLRRLVVTLLKVQ